VSTWSFLKNKNISKFRLDRREPELEQESDFQIEKFAVSSEISDLLLLVCYFASQNIEIKCGNCFLMCVVEIKTFWLDVRYPQQAITGITRTTGNFWT